MHLAIDAVPVERGSSAVVVAHLLRGWREAWPADRLTVLCGPGGPAFEVPEGVGVEIVTAPPLGPLSGLWRRAFGVRRAARRLRPDAVISGVPASSLLGTGTVRGLILYDLRHELRPEQFSRSVRLARAVSWRWSMSRADGIYTISERTLDDLRTLHPRLARRAVAAVLGSEHATTWQPEEPTGPYALAFGHFANKNVTAVLQGWAAFARSHPEWRLRLVGMGAADRESAAELVEQLGASDQVELMPWLDDEAFAACFAGAGLVVFPSDFEGFGLPAVEALRLGIPVVVSPDPALMEVTGGHAAVARSTSADDLREAMEVALARTAEQREAGRQHAAGLSWTGMARTIRASLVEHGAGRQVGAGTAR
jgi:glycosyltransferase involved in cell wall biosynthesis